MHKNPGINSHKSRRSSTVRHSSTKIHNANMKFAVVLLALTACVLAADDDHYTTKYDNVNIDAILANKRLTTNYVNCLLDKGKCSEDGKVLKEVIPDALVTDCRKCNEKQKTSVKKVALHLLKNRKSDWDALIAKYDPEGKYKNSYQPYIDEANKS